MQHKADSLMEAVANTAVGFVFSMAIYVFIVNPLFGLKSSAAESFLITCIFTVASILRQYILRRVFNGKSVYSGVRSWLRPAIES